MKRTKSHAWLAGLLLILPLATLADQDPETQKWLDKVAQAYSKGPYSLNYTLDMSVSQQGTEMSMRAVGKMLYRDPKAMRIEHEMSMILPGDNPPLTMTTLVVHDGETLWTEVSNPLLGNKQVVKMSAEAAEKLATDRAPSLMAGINPSQLDPASQVALLAKMANLKVAGKAEGKVRLSGLMTDEFRQSLGPAAAGFLGEGQTELSMVLDEKTGQLYEMSIGPAGEPFLVGHFKDMKYLKASDIPKDAFLYQPPAGALVNDMTAVAEDSGRKPAKKPTEKAVEKPDQR
jgi:outer membrane lipoprotein-sorting protein